MFLIKSFISLKKNIAWFQNPRFLNHKIIQKILSEQIITEDDNVIRIIFKKLESAKCTGEGEITWEESTTRRAPSHAARERETCNKMEKNTMSDNIYITAATSTNLLFIISSMHL